MASLIEAYGWHEWLCKTNFSFLVGASHPQDIVETAVNQGYQSLAVNDFDGVYGLARTYREHKDIYKKMTAVKQLKLHYGAEIHLALDHDQPILLQDTLVLIAQSWEGYRNLCLILNYTHRGGKKNAHVFLEDLAKFNVKDLVAIQPMRGVMRGSAQTSLDHRLAILRELFAGQFYFTVSRHFHRAEDYWIRATLETAKKWDSPLLLTQDAFFHAPQQKPMSDLLHAIRSNKTVDTAGEHYFPNSERSLHSLAALEANFRSFSFYETALKNSRALAESCNFCFSSLRYQYPKEMIPPGFTSQEYLEKLTWDAVRERFGTASSALAQQINNELGLINHLQFADYFLTVWDIVRWARSQNILCQGRGSAANSSVCYMLGITSVDPTVFDLLFERFLSMERGDPPDIDVDFEHERREEVIQYIYQRYGRERASMVANVITYRRKGALRAVGKALGVDEATLKKVSKICETRYFRGNESQLILEQLDASAKKALAGISFEVWAQMTEELRGFPRHIGIHSGGFMLSQNPLHFLVAQEPATMEGRSVVQWCKEDIEGLNFFKIDILALGMLTAVRKCFTYIKDNYGRELSMATIPADDAATYAMIQKSDTVGTFQIESRAQMSMLPRLKPKNLYDLVIEVAIIRPGPIQGNVIHPYLRRREGKEKITYPDPRLAPILNRTLGVPIFQEQLMRIAMVVGNFTAGEANELRKNIGSWNIKDFRRNLDPWLERLVEGMKANGLPQEFIDQMIGQMKGFASYGFPESHAVSFALIAYVSSYLKCHYPAAFFASILNAQPMGFYSVHALLQAAMRAGVEILPVCVNHSTWDHQLEKTQAHSALPQLSLRLGFRVVAGLRQVGAEALVAARQRLGGEFQTLEHLLGSGQIFRGDLTALAAANALQCFGLSRSAALWKVEAAPFCPNLEDVEKEIKWRRENAMDTVHRDFAAFSTTLGEHPCKLIRDSYWTYPIQLKRIILAQRLETMAANQIVDVFGMTLVKQSPPSAKGMVFFTLEDDTGFINLAFTPQVYARLYELAESQAFLLVRGKLQKAGLYHSILVREIYARNEQQAEIIQLNEEKSRREEKDNGRTAAAIAELYQPRNYM